MVISLLRDITWMLHLSPGMLIWVELVCVLCIVISENSTENYNLMAENSWFMVGNISRISFECYRFPTDSVFRIFWKFLKTTNAQSPHISHWTFFNVSSSMNVQTKYRTSNIINNLRSNLLVINNETAMIKSSLGQLSWQTHLTPFKVDLSRWSLLNINAQLLL